MAAFTAIAAGIGLAITAATTGASFGQAAKQRKLQAKAEKDAEQFMADARRRLDVNYYKALSIAKEPYELEREALAAAGAQAIEAAREGEYRGIGATAGRIQMAQNEAQAGIRTAMGREQSMLEKLVSQEESRLRDINVQLDLEEVAGAQLAQAQAWEAEQLATQQGMEGVSSLVQQAAAFAPLYAKGESGRKTERLFKEFEKSGASKEYSIYDWLKTQGVDLSGVGGSPFLPASSLEIKDFLSQQQPSYIKNLLEQLREW